jgi:hypothetical protein
VRLEVVVLAVNNAGGASERFVFFRGPEPAAVFSIDNGWVRRNRAFLSRHPGEKYVALPLETWPDCGGIDGVTYLRHSTALGLSRDPGTINGCDSGHGALNLAFLKGARRIRLIGFDMNPDDKEIFRTWLPRYRPAAEQLRAAGVQVVNMNPDSYVDVFPKATGWEEA